MKPRILLLGLLLAPTLLLALLVPAAPASAGTYIELVNATSKACLVDDGTPYPAVHTCEGYANQVWIMSGYDSVGQWYRLENAAHPHHCLDLSRNGLQVLNYCQPPGQYEKYQAWHFSGTGVRNSFLLQSQYNHSCLYSTSRTVTTAACASSGGARTAETWVRYVDGSTIAKAGTAARR